MVNDRNRHIGLRGGKTFTVNLYIYINGEHNFRSFIDDCRILRFKPPMEGYSLQGHVFKNLTMQGENTCEINCFLEHGCVSYNIEPSHEDDINICELSDSDHEIHPEALDRRNGFTYRTTEVISRNTFDSQRI